MASPSSRQEVDDSSHAARSDSVTNRVVGDVNAENVGKEHEKKEKKSLSQFCYLDQSSASGAIIISKKQYSGNSNHIVFGKNYLKILVANGDSVEKKLSYLSLLKHKFEIGTISARRAEKACKANRNIIPLGDSWGCLPSLFFPKTEEDTPSCKITLLIKKANSINGETYFCGSNYVSLNVNEFREMIREISVRIDESEGGVSWRLENDVGATKQSELDEYGEDQSLKFNIPSSSEDEEPKKKYQKKGKKVKERKKKGKKYVIYDSESD